MPAIAPLPHQIPPQIQRHSRPGQAWCGKSVWLLCGGPSSEYRVSLGSARSVLLNFPYDRWCVRLVCWAGGGARRGGSWLISPHAFFETPDEALLDATFATLERPNDYPLKLSAAEMLAQLEADEPEAALNVMHGTGGEDGVIQGFFQVAGVPMTGSGVAASALAMDKAKSRVVLAQAGLRPARGFAVGPDELEEALSPTLEGRDRLDALGRRIGAELGLPAIIKPAIGGSSFGLTLLRELGGLEQALRLAMAESLEGEAGADQMQNLAAAATGPVLIEEFLAGREFTCGVLEEIPNSDDSSREGVGSLGELRALAVTEIIPGGDGELFDYNSKYTAGAAHEITPAPIGWALTQAIQHEAMAAHRALGCGGYSRTDFRLDGPPEKGGRPRVLEVNTLPGMTGTSLLPQGAEASGIPFPQLLTRMIESATGVRAENTEPIKLSRAG